MVAKAGWVGGGGSKICWEVEKVKRPSSKENPCSKGANVLKGLLWGSKAQKKKLRGREDFCEGSKQQSFTNIHAGWGDDMGSKDICKGSKRSSTDQKMRGGVAKCAGKVFVRKWSDWAWKEKSGRGEGGAKCAGRLFAKEWSNQAQKKNLGRGGGGGEGEEKCVGSVVKERSDKVQIKKFEGRGGQKCSGRIFASEQSNRAQKKKLWGEWKNVLEEYLWKKNCEGAKRPSLKRKIRAGGRGKMCWTAICEGVKQSSSKQNPGGGGRGQRGSKMCWKDSCEGAKRWGADKI